MAEVLACDVCGRVSDPKKLPPDVEPCRWANSIEDHSVAVCRDCQRTKTLAEILEHAQGAPGGTLDGAARGPYLVIDGDV
jgi:hypothetical protein